MKFDKIIGLDSHHLQPLIGLDFYYLIENFMTIQDLKQQNLILLEVISGSKSFGINTPSSDTDIKGVYFLPKEKFFGLDYIPQISNETNDEVYYELRTALAGKWIVENNSIPTIQFTDLLYIAPRNIQEKILELQEIKANQNEKYLHPKEVIITDYLRETVSFNQEKASSLGSGKKMAVELDGVFRDWIKL